MAPNYSLHSIPVYWFLALAPHAYAVRSFHTSPNTNIHLTNSVSQVGVAKKANNGHWDNTNPRNTSYLEQKVPKEALARYERAEAAHANGMENAPFFIGAVLAGNFAGLDASKYPGNWKYTRSWNYADEDTATLNAYTGVYIGLRVLYNVLYVRTTTLKSSRARSLVWLVSTVSLFVLYFKAANRMLARG